MNSAIRFGDRIRVSAPGRSTITGVIENVHVEQGRDVVVALIEDGDTFPTYFVIFPSDLIEVLA